MATIVTNELFSENNLLSLIIESNIEGLKSFISEIDTAINANWDIQDKNLKIMKALKVAGFGETDQYKKLYAVNQDIAEVNTTYSELRRKASCALDELA